MDVAGVSMFACLDETQATYGEVAWSWRRDPGVYPVPPECGFGNGGKKGRSPGSNCAEVDL